MANHVSAEKRNRQRIVRTERNRSIRTIVRNAVKKARAAIAAGDKSAAAGPAHAAAVALAKAAGKGVLHQKTAARATSRLAAALAKLG